MRVLKCSGVLMGLIRGCGAQKTAHLNTFVSSHNIAYCTRRAAPPESQIIGSTFGGTFKFRPHLAG